MALVLGTHMGPYEILEPLGAGGMGAVYRARDPRLDREVAIKVSEARFSERFEREARAIAAVNHPHICQIYDVGPDYLVMELIKGRPLAGPLPLDQALSCAAQICDALDAAHRKGIAHRDLKPANILVTKAGIKLLDFGLAKTVAPVQPTSAADETVTGTLTGKNEIVGTLHYMSPEQLLARGEQIDVRTDIFSFGLVFYEMLMGKRAFDGPSPASVIAAILERPAPSVGAIAPPEIDRVLQRCLAKDPDDRWQTARDLRAGLQLIASVPAEPSAAVQSARRLPILLAAGALVLAVLSAASWLRRPVAPAAPRMQINMELPAGENLTYPTLSPDGTKIAFRTSKGFWVRALDSSEMRLVAIPAGPGTSSITWSPDGRFLLYYDGTRAGELRKVPVAGGLPQTVSTRLVNIRGAAWSIKGLILFSTGGPIMSVSENGGATAPITAEKGSFPTMLPDERHFLFLGGVSGTDESIQLGSFDPTPQRKITAANSQAEFAPGGHLLFLRGVTLMAQAFDPASLRTIGEPIPLAPDVHVNPNSHYAAFSSAPNGLIVYQTGGVGRSALTWIDRSGKPIGVVDEANLYQDIDLSPDGKMIVATRVDPGTLRLSAWITDLTRGVTSRFTPETERVDWPTWSPDGKRIAYRVGPQVCIRDVAGSGMLESLPSEREGLHVWSPNGAMLAIGGTGLALVPLGGDHKPVVSIQGQFAQPAFSPDGHWIAYASAESGSFEVFVQSFPVGHGKWQISPDGGGQPVWRRDGKELFYISAGHRIVAVPVKIGVTFEAGTPKELFSANNSALFYFRRQYSVSPDGQRFLVNLHVEDHPKTILLQNWLSQAR